MSDISNIYSKMGAAYDMPYTKNSKDTDKAEKSDKTEGKEAVTASKIPGKVIGNPKLSDKAKKYYEELRSKFHNMEFILVSDDQKEAAKSKAASFANASKMVVLIDEAKLERMAEDSSFRSKYEDIIEKAAVGFSQFSSSIASSGANIKGYGMQVNDDGTTSLFAVLKDSSDAQAKRIAEKRVQKQQQKKADAKKAQKEKAQERLEKAIEERKSEKKEKINLNKVESSDDDTVITANSFEELARKIEDYMQNQRTDSVVTESEKQVGQHIDFAL